IHRRADGKRFYAGIGNALVIVGIALGHLRGAHALLDVARTYGRSASPDIISIVVLLLLVDRGGQSQPAQENLVADQIVSEPTDFMLDIQKIVLILEAGL